MYHEAKNLGLALALLAFSAISSATTTDVTNLRLAGPYSTIKPLMTDSLDSEGNRIDDNG